MLCTPSSKARWVGGQGGGVEEIWTKSKRTATFFSHEAFPKSHISRKKINRLLFSGLYPTRQLGRSRFWNKILNPISEAYRFRRRDLIIATAGLAPNIPWKENMLISPEKPVQVQNEKLERTSIYESPFLYHYRSIVIVSGVMKLSSLFNSSAFILSDLKSIQGGWWSVHNPKLSIR